MLLIIQHVLKYVGQAKASTANYKEFAFSGTLENIDDKRKINFFY